MIKNIKAGIALGGYDSVSYFQNKKPIKGSQDIVTDYEGAKYQFSSQENKEIFLQNPEQYIPSYGGFCAIAMSEGSVVDANPKSYLIQDNRLLVFFATGPFMIINTRNQWMKKDGVKLMKDADEVYDAMINDVVPIIKNTYK